MCSSSESSGALGPPWGVCQGARLEFGNPFGSVSVRVPVGCQVRIRVRVRVRAILG